MCRSIREGQRKRERIFFLKNQCVLFFFFFKFVYFEREQVWEEQREVRRERESQAGSAPLNAGVKFTNHEIMT